jgi:hypothetical protein
VRDVVIFELLEVLYRQLKSLTGCVKDHHVVVFATVRLAESVGCLEHSSKAKLGWQMYDLFWSANKQHNLVSCTTWSTPSETRPGYQPSAPSMLT